jgi:hypothetical protein
MDNINAFINKYKLKLILDNKSLLLSYVLLMIINYIIINEIIFDKNKLKINPTNINYIYITLVFCLIINLLLINYAMKSKTLEIFIFNRELLSKNVFILFTFLQCIVTILSVFLLLNSNNNYTNKQKYLMVTQIIMVNFIAIAFTWSYATTSCNVVDKLI